MKWKQFAKLYIALLLLANFHQMSSTPSTKKVKTRTKMDDPTDYYVYACLKYDYQVHEALASTKPPFDNYFNISRAIYPSEDVSSKLVNIWVHFTNSSVNLTEVNQLKFIWSRSCLYVSDRYLSLRAMGLYSLFTIWPDRGQEDLHITLYQFCDPRQTKRKLINFLSTLEDIAISPSSFNPSLNSVECVADGGYENHLKNINKAFPQICWLILFSSLIGSNLIRMLVLKYCRGESSRAKSILSLVFVVLLCGTIVAIVAVIYSRQAQIIYPLTYLLFILLIFLLCSVYYLFQAGNEDNKINIVCLKFGNDGKLHSESILLWTTYPGIFIAVHHALWVMIGIITEPYWALPVATSFIMFAFLFYVLSALYFSPKYPKKWDTSAKINFGFMIAAGISVVMVQLSFLLVGNQFFDESLLSSAIQSALVVMISIWFRSIKDEKANQQPGKISGIFNMGVFDGLLQPPERKALFMVGTRNSERKGIGCAVECEGKYYVLTCRDVASPEDAGADNEHEFILDRYCSNHPKHVGKHRSKALDILCDDKRSFLLLPDDQVLSSHFLLSADSKKKEKVYSYFLSDDGKRAQSIDWSYNNNTRKYSIGRDLDRKNFLGSPVLYSDKTDKTFVVGVVGEEENTYHPIFFESASLPYPGAPSQVYIVPVPREITEDRLTLTWAAPKDNGGVITEYTVYQRKVNGSPSDWERKPTGLHSLQHEIVGLERGKIYEFQVTATNRYGESPKGADATRGVRVLGVPNQVKIVEYPSEIIEDRVTLTWRAPEDNGTVVTQYTVYQREVNEDGSRSNWKGEATGRDVLQYEVVGLESGKMYEFQVTATNQCGESTRVEKGPNIVQIACVSPDSLLEFLLFKIFSFLNNAIWSWRNWTEG